MEVWKISFLSKWVIWRIHVNLPGCIRIFRIFKGGMSLTIPTQHRELEFRPCTSLESHKHVSLRWISNLSFVVPGEVQALAVWDALGELATISNDGLEIPKANHRLDGAKNRRKEWDISYQPQLVSENRISGASS